MKVLFNSVIYRTHYFLVCLLLLLEGSYHHGVAQQRQTGTENTFMLADPHIYFHEGLYYLYGTASNEGFKVYASRDLKNWEGPVGANSGFALKKGDAFGNSRFWAPQVFSSNDKFYMAYAADEHIAIAVSKSPSGPFTQSSGTALRAPVKQIDPFVFFDDDGRKYLYHVRVANGGNRIFVAEMTDDLSGIKTETLKECISATEAWENRAKDKWSVAEGPTLLKHKGLYYLIYSANHFRSPDYAVGYAVSKSPFGPWEKYKGNPILSKKNIGVNGTGHGDLVTDAKGNMFYVFHTHHSDTVVGPRRTALVTISFAPESDTTDIDGLKIDERSFRFLEK
jgi:xylan 1,4-beta-xylosidase